MAQVATQKAARAFGAGPAARLRAAVESSLLGPDRPGVAGHGQARAGPGGPEQVPGCRKSRAVTVGP